MTPEEQTFADAIQVHIARYPNTFYDGPDDPLYAAAAQFQAKIDAEIEAAGGIDAWREQHRKSQKQVA